MKAGEIMNNKNILFVNKNLNIFKIGEVYSFSLVTINNRSLKLILKEINELISEIDSNFIESRKVNQDYSDLIELKRKYGFSINQRLTTIIDKNNNSRISKMYFINADSVFFSSIEALICYLQGLLLDLKFCLTEFICETNDDEFEDAEDIFDIK